MVERIDILITEKGGRTVKRSITDIGGAAEGSDRRVLSLQRTLRQFAIGAGLAIAVRQTLAFQDAIAEVSTLVDTATFDLQGLTEATLEQAAAFGQAPTAQAQAFYQIISAGASTAAEANELLEASNRLAIGGVTEVGIAADGLTSILNAYGLATSDAASVSDTLFIAVREGKTTVEELSTTLGRVTPLAASAGVSFDELAAATAALTTGGISTNEAVTGLRGVIASVVKPSQEATEAARSLGIEFNAAALESQGLEGFLNNVVRSTGGSTDALAQLFGGVEALVPILALSGEAGENFADILVELEDKAGATEEAFNQIANSPGFQIGRIFASITAEATRTVSVFTSALVPGLRFVADSIDEAADFLRAFGVTLAVVFAPSTITATIGLATTAFIALTAAIAANPFGAIAIAIAAVIGLLTAFADEISLGEGRLANLQDFGLATFEGLLVGLDNLVVFFQDSFALLSGIFENTFGGLEITFEGVVRAAAQTADSIIGFFQGGAAGIVIAFENIPQSLELIFVSAFNAISNRFTGFLNFIISGISEVTEFAGLGAIEQIEGFELQASSAAVNVGSAISTAIAAGIEGSTAVEDALDGLLARSEEIAQERLAREATQAAPTTNTRVPVDDTVTPTSDISAFNDLAEALRLENELIALNASERQIRQTVIEIEDSLGRSLTQTERQQVEALTLQNQALRTQNEILGEIQGPQQSLVERQEALQILYDQGRISLEQFNVAMRDLNVEMSALDNTLSGGLQNGFDRIIQQTNDLGSSVSDILVGAFDDATQAVVDFAQTGELNIRDFFGSLTAQLLQLATNQLFAQLLGGLGGGGGALASAGGAIGGLLGFQTGGSATVAGSGGPDSQLVQFMATPGERVNVETPQQQRSSDSSGGDASPVNLRVVNQIDPSETLSTLETPAGERTIMNVIERNPAAVSAILNR